MEFTKEHFKLENSLKKEWLITNGIGGYASSTIIGTNTRKYHGLLVAPLSPPAQRYLILSKIDESIEINNKKYDFYTNISQNYISQGFKYQISFKKEYLPIFTYKIEDIEITKVICMEYGKNTVGIFYKVKNGKNKIKLNLAPIVNFRDFHTMATNHIFNIKQEINKNKIKLIVDNKNQYPIYINSSEGRYVIHENDMFKDMFYVEEEKRGFYPKENHSVPGVYEIEINPNEEKEISIVCSLENNIEEINVKDLIDKEIKRIDEDIRKTELIDLNNPKEEDKIIKEFLQAVDNFIVYRPSFRLHTLIAGYPWFLDWGRDSLISFEGLLLKTKKYDIAREILLTMCRDIKFGLVPNGYSGFDNRPLYNSVDSSLLLFEQIKKYINYTGDYEFIKENIYEKLKKIIDSYINGIDLDDNNIYLDIDGLIVSGTEKTQNTWMDAKCGQVVATPRNGKAVEINSLWYNSLMIMEELTKSIGKKEDAKKYESLAQKCKTSFNEKFYNAKRKCLYDVLGDSKIRPNQLFSLSLTYPIIEPDSERAYNIIDTVEKKLLNKYGLKTLAKGEENYIEVYEGDSFKRDMSYHQGITWVWLLGLYYDSLKNMIKYEKKKNNKNILEEKLKNFVEQTAKTFIIELEENGCIGNISEMYDSKKPQNPKGTIAQSWSVAEVFRIILHYK